MDGVKYSDGLKFVQLPDLRVGLVAQGPAGGMPVLLLHGFPEFWYSWRLQLPALAGAGFRAIAPDQRGYNRTGKTPPYDLETLTQDVANLQDALGIRRCAVVGHDWGAVVAYAFAARFPGRVSRLAILNGPHPDAYLDALRASLSQLRKSWYVFFFQLPGLAERAIARNDYAFADRIFRGVRSMTRADVARYKDAWSQSGALSAMVGWYRALGRRVLRRRGPVIGVVHAPVRVIWGDDDGALDKAVNNTLARWAPVSELCDVPGASHWVQMDEPERVNGLLIDWLSRDASSAKSDPCP